VMHHTRSIDRANKSKIVSIEHPQYAAALLHQVVL
jgi:hypothetical protein